MTTLPPAPFGVDTVQKFGRNGNVDSGDPLTQDIWTVTGVCPFPSAAAATTIVSSSVNDAPAGTGTRTVVVQGVLSDYTLASETATLNGTTPVTLTNQFLRVFRMFADESGSGLTNAGNIQAKHGATVLAQIDAGKGQTLMAVYTIPADYEKAFIETIFVSIGKSAVAAYAAVELQFRPFGGSWRVAQTFDPNVNGASAILREYPRGLKFSPKTDLRLRAVLASANDLTISGQFDLVLYRKGAV